MEHNRLDYENRLSKQSLGGTIDVGDFPITIYCDKRGNVRVMGSNVDYYLADLRQLVLYLPDRKG